MKCELQISYTRIF